MTGAFYRVMMLVAWVVAGVVATSCARSTAPALSLVADGVVQVFPSAEDSMTARANDLPRSSGCLKLADCAS